MKRLTDEEKVAFFEKVIEPQMGVMSIEVIRLCLRDALKSYLNDKGTERDMETESLTITATGLAIEMYSRLAGLYDE